MVILDLEDSVAPSDKAAARAAISVDGKMVDQPVLARAQVILGIVEELRMRRG